LKEQTTSKFLVILFIFSFAPFFLSHEKAINFSPYNYGICQLLLFGIVYSLKGFSKNVFLFSPSFIAVSYINLNFLLGSFVFQSRLVFNDFNSTYSSWNHANLVMTYFNLANFAIVLSYFLAPKISFFFNLKSLGDLRKFSSGVIYFTGSCIIIIFTIFEFNLDIIGGDGSFSEVPKTLGAILIIVNIFRNPSIKKRIILYFILLLCFSIMSWEDKRDAIFLLLPMLILESTKFKLKINLKKILLILCSVGLVFYLIIVMSIIRGYGQYKVDGFLEANNHVLDYVKGDNFIPSFMNNLEISYTYLHSNNAVEKIIEYPELKTYGGTIIKPLFILIPRNIMPNKPQSIIHHYTNEFSQEYREKGGSWPVSFQSEMFWNFSFFGVFIGAIFFYIFNILYKYTIKLTNVNNIINYIPLLYFYEALLILFRGSGLDMFFVFILISTIIFITLKVSLRVIYVIVKAR